MITYGSTTLTSYNSIVKTEVYYYKSTSATSLSGGSWATTKPTWENGKYIWQKIRTVYEDGTHTESDPVNITGQQGATGTAAYSYKLNSSDSIIGKTKDGEYTIKKITFSATYKQGTGAVSAYSGRFKIESTTNGSTWKTEYTSSGNEASKEFTIPDDIIAIKCSLYQSGGTTVLLDIVTVPVVKDGVDAIGLRDSIPYYLASDKDIGITRLTQGWTRYRPQLTAEKKYLWVYYVSRYSEGTTEPELIEIKDDLVHFVNNGDESPVESCVVDIEPVQDLNGYDHPWPAGGGVNKLLPRTSDISGTTSYGITFSYSVETETLTMSGTNSDDSAHIFFSIASPYFIAPEDFQVDDSFWFAGIVPTGAYAQIVYRRKDTGVPTNLKYISGNGQFQVISGVIPDNFDGIVRVDVGVLASKTVSGTAKLMLSLESSAPTEWTPYSNICPINGWTNAKVTRTGKNMLNSSDPDYDNYTIGPDGAPTSESTRIATGFIPCDEGAQLTFSTNRKTDGVGTAVQFAFAGIAAYDKDKNFLTRATVNNKRTVTFTIPTGTKYVRAFEQITIRGSSVTATPTDFATYEQQLELGTTATEYEPYQGDTYDITFPTESGTVYGGQLNVTTGKLTVDRAMVKISDLSWYYSHDYGYYGTQKDVANIKNPTSATTLLSGLICSAYKSGAAAETGSQKVNGTIGVFTSRIRIRDENYGSDVNTWASTMGNETIVYPLATPQIYTLTPQEITMLCKENNIWTDTGQTAISYYDNQTSTDPYVDYSLTSAFDASTIEPAYIETEWVESTGKQYVYLDWKPPIKTWGFEIDFISYNALGTTVGAWNEDTNKNGYGTIFGVRNASGVNNAQLSSYSNGLLRIGNGTNQATGFKTNHTRQQIKLQNTTITKADGTTSTVSRLDETANKPYCNMTVFGLHDGLRRAGNGGISEPSSTRIYSLKFYDGDTLTVDLVGAIRKRDSVTGLYDKVSKHFYPAPGMLFGDVVGDIGDSISMKEAMDKANPQTIVVNKDRTRMWEATVPFNDLQDGQKITVTYSYGNVVSSVETDELIGWDDTSNNQQVYLKLTFADGHKTDWIPCYYSNTSRLTTHYGAGIPIQLTYRENILANASETASGNMVLRGFYADANYDTNTTDIVRWSYGRVIAGSNKIFPYSIIMQNADERWESIVTSSTTAKTKTRNTHGFRLDTILYQAANTTTNENAENTSYQLRTGDPIMDMRYNLNIEDTNELRLVHGKSVYLVGTVGTDGLFYLADQWWSQSLPTIEDGKIYIFLGQVYDWYRCGLATMHPIYKFVDGKLKSTLQIAVDALDKAKEVAQDLADLGADLQAQIDGKIETWCQSTDPSTAWTTTELKNQHNGDLWYYTGESTSSYKNNTTYKYTASTNKWTAYSASTDLFDKIDAKASIYYGKPSAVTQNLEVGDYLVDSTDGCSYRWDGSKWVKLTDYNAAIDEIEVGGRNLLLNSATEKTGASNVAQWMQWAISDSPLVANEEYMFSFDAKMSNNTDVFYIGFALNSSTQEIMKQEVLVTDTYKRYTYKVKTTKTNINSIIISNAKSYGHGNANNSTGILNIKNVKLEKGNKATKWTPAPEDIETELTTIKNNLQSQIDEKIQTYYQSSNPASAWTTTALRTAHDGDLWYYTGTTTATYTKDNVYRYNGSNNTWTTYSASGELFDKIDGKSTIYYGTTSDTYTGVETGDYLIDANDGSSYRYDGSKWVKVTDYKSAIDNIEVGGRNLARNTQGAIIDKIGAAEGSRAEYAAFDLGCALPLNDNDNISISFDLYMVVRTAKPKLNVYNTNNQGVHQTCITTNVLSGNSYQVGDVIDKHIAFVSTIHDRESSTLPHDYLEFYSDYGSNNFFRISNLKVEKGNRSTDWTPAPEDVDASIATAQSTADTALDRATAIYGTCSTDSTVDAKVVICPDFVLFDGARIQVTFTNANTASAPTLNVNDTGAKAIYINKTVASNTNQLLWTAGSKMEFVYDGTGWVAQNVPYALYGTCSTGASTVAKDVTCNEAVICKGTTISVNMAHTNTAADATLNVGSTLAKDIYANGAKLTTNSRFNWRANTTQKFVFDGQVWRMDDDSVKALATAYITEIDDDGIMVHPEDDSTSGWAISDAIQLFKSGISYIKLWIENNIPKIRIGKEDQGHIILDNDSVDVRDGDDVLATFGENTRIGTEDGTYLSLSTEGLIGSKNNLQYMQFLANGESQICDYETNFGGFFSDSPQYYTHYIAIDESVKDYIVFDFKVDQDSYSFVQQLEIKNSEVTYTFEDSDSQYQVITRFISNSKYMTCHQTLTLLESQASKVKCTFKYIVTKQKQSPIFTLGTRVGNSEQGLWSYSEGLNNIASGDFSCVEGENNTASGSYAHAEGNNVTASGIYSHAGGDSTISDRAYAFVHGCHLISNNEAQAVFGKYNRKYDSDSTTYLFIIGNGVADRVRSDAFIVDNTGNIFLDTNPIAHTGTADAKLYDAICALGWQDDIINDM